MHITFRLLLIITITAVLAACDEPTMFMAGGALDGEVTDPPSTWAFEQESGLAQLETRPQEPYSINLAYVQLNGQLYVYAGDTRTTWVTHIEQDPRIRIRVDEKIYPLHAVRVGEGEELDEFAAAWAGRSIFQRDPKQFEEVWLYRLEVRR